VEIENQGFHPARTYQTVLERRTTIQARPLLSYSNRPVAGSGALYFSQSSPSSHPRPFPDMIVPFGLVEGVFLAGVAGKLGGHHIHRFRGRKFAARNEPEQLARSPLLRTAHGFNFVRRLRHVTSDQKGRAPLPSRWA